MKEIWYDKETDILNIELNSLQYWKSIELPNGIVFDVTEDGSITAIEVLNASKLFFGDAKKIIEMAKPVSDIQ
jgi:uncharacterized protein YuzE